MSKLLANVGATLRGVLPWRYRSGNNYRVATANRYFEEVRRTPPIQVREGSEVEVHCLICHRDVNMLLTSTKSFLRYVPDASLVFHDDGSITGDDIELLRRHLPGHRFISRTEADDELRKILPEDAFAMRAKYFFLLKLFDFNHFHRGTRTILLDSDIVFLSKPTEIIDWISDPTPRPFYNLDWCPSYRAKSMPAGIEIPPCLNAGFMGYAGRFEMEQIWGWCRQVDYWLEDQTIYALLLAGHGASALDEKRYRVYTGGDVSLDTPMIHFIGPSRFKTLLYPKLARRVYEQLSAM